MKTVFTNREIPHLFANGRTDEARNSSYSLTLQNLPHVDGTSLFSYQTEIAKCDEARERRDEKERLKREREAREAIPRLESWKRGGSFCPSFHNLPVALRESNINPSAIETSHGAMVSYPEARILWRALRAGEKIIGRKIGHYTVISVDSEFVKIGCRRIPVSEIERIFAS